MMISPVALTAALTAVVENLMDGGTRLHFIPMETAEVAREEFPDAQAFVRDTACTECGFTASEVLECWSCETRGCRCLIEIDENTGRDICEDCVR